MVKIKIAEKCDHNPWMLHGHVVVRNGFAFCLRCRKWYRW